MMGVQDAFGCVNTNGPLSVVSQQTVSSIKQATKGV